MEMFDFREITPNEKYSWQEDLINDDYYKKDTNGIYMIMSRTGTGKTVAQYHKMLHFKDNNKKTVTIYVPFKNKNLVEQIYKEFINCLHEDPNKIPFKEHNINTKRKEISLGDNFTVCTHFCFFVGYSAAPWGNLGILYIF